ncbi:hypothetical protein BDN70DRAFT_886481 [Pholiota conissans]|uniref:DUF7918 domain-containing protein n=1 Tax=Pholiota conissans TaxID=109636 RepID=A0A9P6CNH6_9AGAR|nr:hypothetical protein BDN70DRAFT_886481 [Pholiota conissans]
MGSGHSRSVQSSSRRRNKLDRRRKAANTPTTTPKAKVRKVLSYGEFKVWIDVDGQKLPIYGAKCDSNKGLEVVMSCWIASVEAKEFSISFQRTQFDDYDFKATVTVDGHIACESIYRNVEEDADEPQTVWGTRISRTEERSFVFGKVEYTNDDAELDDPSIQDIGKIEVILEKIDVTGTKRTKEPDVYGEPNIGKVHERAKKGLDHQIKYGPIEVCEPLDDEIYLFAKWGDKTIFTFKYRSLATLQAMGLAPKPKPIEPPTPAAPETAPIPTPSPTPEPMQEQLFQESQAQTQDDVTTPEPAVDSLPEPESRRTTAMTPASAKKEHSVKRGPTVKREHSASEDLEDTKMESDSEDEEIKEMLATAHKLLAKVESKRRKRRAEKEKVKDASRAPKRVKTELKMRHFVPGEIIDLT